MTESDRVEKLLALLLIQQMKDEPQRKKIYQLSLVGFSSTEIADLLDTTSAVVRTLLYETRKTRRKPNKGIAKPTPRNRES